jgi:hypothetical protein
MLVWLLCGRCIDGRDDLAVSGFEWKSIIKTDLVQRSHGWWSVPLGFPLRTKKLPEIFELHNW